MEKKVLVVIVTHNSQKYINWVIEPFLQKDSIFHVRIVDSGSTEKEYLYDISGKEDIDVIFEENIGFAKANNKGLYDIVNYDYVLFLNPDARVEYDVLNTITQRADTREYSDYAIFSVPLIRYDFDNKAPTAFYDSLGIYCDYMGRWKDKRGKVGDNSVSKYEAICGAFMFCRASTLLSLKDNNGNVGFEETFFMYKEDIELSLRMRKKWKLHIFDDLIAYHCRGWGGKRSENAYWSRFISAKNDIKIALKYKKRALPFALIKYMYVIFLERKTGKK